MKGLGSTAKAHEAAIAPAVRRLSRAAAVAAETPANAQRAFDQATRVTREAARVLTHLEMVPTKAQDAALISALRVGVRGQLSVRYAALAANAAQDRRINPAPVAVELQKRLAGALRAGFAASRGQGLATYEGEDGEELLRQSAWARVNGDAPSAAAVAAEVARRRQGQRVGGQAGRYWNIPENERCAATFDAWTTAEGAHRALGALSEAYGTPRPTQRRALDQLRVIVGRCVVPRRMTEQLPGAVWRMRNTEDPRLPGGILEIDGARPRRRRRRRS